MVINLPQGGLTVLGLVANGQSPWTGWASGTEPKTQARHMAYQARARTIRECRKSFMLDDEGLLTPLGEGVLELAALRHG